jgi:tetratricopeptide (TPR) repeat protein
MRSIAISRFLAAMFATYLVVAALPALAQQSVKVRAGVHEDYGRIVFEWPSKSGYKAVIAGKELVVTFDKPLKASYTEVTRRLAEYISAPKILKSGKQVRFPLRGEFSLSARQFDKLVVLDLLKTPPPEEKPAEVKQAEKDETQPRAKPAVAETPAGPVAPTATVAKVVSERSAAEAVAARETALALEQENKKRAEEEMVATALAQAKTINDEKQAAISVNGEIDFELRVKEIAGGVRLRFPFPKDVAAAVFLRGEYLWVVFEKPARVDLSILSLLKRDVLLRGEQYDDQDATVLAFKIAPGFLPRVERRHSVWQIDLLPEAGTPDGILPVVREPEAEPNGLVRIQAGNPTGPISVIDPVIGDKLIIAPVLEATQAVVEGRNYVDFELLATSQGVALVAKSDQLKVKATQGSVEITATSGLQISDDVARVLGAGQKTGMVPLAPAYMDFERWRRGAPEKFNEIRDQLRASIASTRLVERKKGQMNLAQFYLAHGLEAETLGILKIMAKEDENVVNDSYYSGLSGVANYYLGRYGEAEKDLSVPGLKNDSHAKLWLGAIKARQDMWKEALTGFDSGFAVLGKYSPEIRAEMRLLAGTAALSIGENERAERELNNVKIAALNPHMASEAHLLQASLFEARGKTDAALDSYDKVIATHYRPTEIPARLSRVLLLNKLNSQDNSKTIDQLEALRYAWRGDDTELKVLEALGSRYTANSSFREALMVMRSAVTYYPNSARSSRIADHMNEVFADLYLRNGSDAMPAIKALALYYDFRELTPLGADGDEMIRRLGERLVAVDLLDEAIELLDHQVRFRLAGTAKAQVAVRLAVIQLLDKQPANALDTIRRTRQTRLPEDLTYKRLILEGRALAELTEYEQALELIAELNDPEANLLRADIYWAAQDWTMAASSLDKVLGDSVPPPDKALDAAIQGRVMRAAIAYALAGQQDGLDKLRGRYDVQMAASPYADSFDVISRSSASNGVAFRQLASTIAGLDTLKDFMASYRRDL